MIWTRASQLPTPSLDDIRRRAHLLIVDDHTVPWQALFERDQYNIQRWNRIANVSQLTDGNFDLILLDLHGVGLAENPTLQGLGILQHIKNRNPTQLVIAYSAQQWSLRYRDFFALADAVLERDDPYLEFKETVDSLLLRRYSLGYFITRMNEALGDHAVEAPAAVRKAIASVRSGSPDTLRRYLVGRIRDEVTVDRALAIIGIAISVVK